ncbi:MAG: PilZ domain-containing protein [Peptococcaceae bacterium]|nr:PilZ domain-containing protein [Peptococcaceae bacterium]
MPGSEGEKRRFFRVKFAKYLDCSAKIVRINQEVVESNKHIDLTIVDLSGGGAQAKSQLDIPFTVKVVLEPQFTLENENFRFTGQISWKNKANNEYRYGIEFVDVAKTEEQRLIKCLNKYELKKTRVLAHMYQRPIKVKSEVERIIEAFAYPAYIVTRDYSVVSVNKAAWKYGLLPGEHCFKSIFANEDICSFCQMEQSSTDDAVVCVNDVDWHGGKHAVYWLYLGNGLFLHYLKLKSQEN